MSGVSIKCNQRQQFCLGPTQAIPKLVVMHPTIQNKKLAWEDDQFCYS